MAAACSTHTRPQPLHDQHMTMAWGTMTAMRCSPWHRGQCHHGSHAMACMHTRPAMCIYIRIGLRSALAERAACAMRARHARPGQWHEHPAAWARGAASTQRHACRWRQVEASHQPPPQARGLACACAATAHCSPNTKRDTDKPPQAESPLPLPPLLLLLPSPRCRAHRLHPPACAAPAVHPTHACMRAIASTS